MWLTQGLPELGSHPPIREVDSDAAACSKRRLLVVDDDPSVCEVVEMVLKLDGHLVETVNSGSEALAVFVPGKFDLVFTDYFMPLMTGDKLAAAIKLRSPNIKKHNSHRKNRAIATRSPGESPGF